jgi:agmatine deiminase
MTDRKLASLTPSSPAARGYRMPAEWAPHAGTWITWPHFEGTWPGKLEAVVPTFVEMVRALHTGETVHINVLNAEREAAVRTLLKENGISTNVRFHQLPTDNEWCRDYGAFFLTRDGEGGRDRMAVNWGFNNWGEKYPDYAQNDHVPAYMAGVEGVPLVHGGLVLEGGAIDVNGAGTLLTTESCLLNYNRNGDLDQATLEQRLRDVLGVQRILWLGDGIAGDDTDGHVDDLTRFVAEDTVVTVVENDAADANHAPLRDNLQRLQAMRLADGSPLRIVTLPMPDPIYVDDTRLPASYANFYIGNEVILLPVFDDPNDEVAENTLQTLFPDRRVVPLDARDLVWGLGAFHCLTQQIPAG